MNDSAQLVSTILKVRCPRKVRRALEMLLASPTEPVKLAELAKSVPCSKFHLCRLFARYFSCSPVRLHRTVRLERAEALVRSGMPSSNVAADLGFADQAHFTRLFKRTYGKTPGRYARATSAA